MVTRTERINRGDSLKASWGDKVSKAVNQLHAMSGSNTLVSNVGGLIVDVVLEKNLPSTVTFAQPAGANITQLDFVRPFSVVQFQDRSGTFDGEDNDRIKTVFRQPQFGSSNLGVSAGFVEPGGGYFFHSGLAIVAYDAFSVPYHTIDNTSGEEVYTSELQMGDRLGAYGPQTEVGSALGIDKYYAIWDQLGPMTVMYAFGNGEAGEASDGMLLQYSEWDAESVTTDIRLAVVSMGQKSTDSGVLVSDDDSFFTHAQTIILGDSITISGSGDGWIAIS